MENLYFWNSISRDSWNLLESFVTESLSPFAFYGKRNFGNNLSRYISGANDKVNYLVLSTKDNGGDYSIELDDSILDKSCVKPVKNLRTLFVYGKTIYYKVGCVKFRFSSQDLLDSFIAESKILFEVKCIDKFLPDFVVKNVKEKKASATLRKLGESFSFEQYQYIANDNRFNLLKGAIVGYVRGGDSSASGPLTELGKTVAENLGKKLKTIFGKKTIALYATDFVRCKDTANLINKGWIQLHIQEL